MGYKPKATKATKITYTDFPGLEVYATAPEIGELMDIADLKLNMNDMQERRMRGLTVFAKYIKSWNVEHPEPKRTKQAEDDPNREVCARCGLAEDMPIPSDNADYWLCLPMDFIMPVFFGWISIVSRVDPTKFLPSNDGGNNTPTDLMQQLATLQNRMPSNVPNLNLD